MPVHTVSDTSDKDNLTMKKFFRDTWKILLAIFIVTASLLYSLIFDGSEIPFMVTFMACMVILFLKALKSLINTVRVFFLLKKWGIISGENEKENTFWHIQIGMNTAIFLAAGWFLGELIYYTWRR